MSLISFVHLDEKELLDLICKEYNLNRAKASINVNYIENDQGNVGSWTVQVQALQAKERIVSEISENEKINIQ